MLIITKEYIYLHITFKQNAMKTVTTQKEICEIFGTKSTLILVNGLPVVRLRSLGNGLKSGYDSRSKFQVSNLKNDLGLAYWASTARTIKDVITYLSK